MTNKILNIWISVLGLNATALCDGLKTLDAIVSFTPKEITVCQHANAKDNPVPIIENIVDQPTLFTWTTLLNSNKVAAKREFTDLSGALCFVVFLQEGSPECVIVQIRITYGLLIVYRGRVQDTGVVPDWKKGVSYYFNPQFVSLVLERLKKDKPDYVRVMNQWFFDATGKTIEEHLSKKPEN